MKELDFACSYKPEFTTQAVGKQQYISIIEYINRGRMKCKMPFFTFAQDICISNMCNLKFPDLYMPKYPQNFAGTK